MFWDPYLILCCGISFAILREMYLAFYAMYDCWDPCVTMLKRYLLPHCVRSSYFSYREEAFLSENSCKKNVSWRDKPLLLEGIWPCCDKESSMYIIIIPNIIWSDLHHLDTGPKDVAHIGRSPLSNVSCSWFVDHCHVSSCLSMHMWFLYALLNAILTTSHK